MVSRKFLLVMAAGVVSAAFSYLGTGLHPVWWALWLAPIPVLAISPRLHGSTAFFLGAIVWLIGEVNQWNYVKHAIEPPPRIIILYFVVPAVVFGFGVLFVRSFIRRGSLFLASLAFPAYWVAYEYRTAMASPHSTWGNLAYTQMNCLPVIQIAAITGIWGISFIVFLFAGAAAALLSGAGERWQRRLLPVAVGLVICAALVFGKWRLQSNPATQSVAVTLIAKDLPMSVYLGSEEQALELLREYADEIGRVTPAGTQAIVLPEKIGRLGKSVLAEVDTLFLPLRMINAQPLSSALFEKRLPPRLTLPVCIRRTENQRRTTTSIISSLVWNPKNPATNESFSTSRRGVGDFRSARTWIFPSSAANTQPRARICYWCLPGTSIWMVGCTGAWPFCAPSKMVSVSLVRRVTGY